MTQSYGSRIITTSLAIFAMLFGAGNLIFPVRIGVQSGGNIFSGFFGFALTGIGLPVLGLMAIVTFQGSYEEFFGRLGKWLGGFLIFCCMMVVGPFIAMPRIMGLSYEMLSPFLPQAPIAVYMTFFALIAFVTTYRMSRLLDIIGKYLSPVKVLSLLSIVAIGLLATHHSEYFPIDRWCFFWKSLGVGYQTLDLIGAIFFGSIVVRLLTHYGGDGKLDMKQAVAITAASGVFAGILLGAVYLGMTCLGAFHGGGLFYEGNAGKVFSIVVVRVLGTYGAAIIGLIVFIAGLTTLVSLSAVVADYVHRDVSKRKLSYPVCVALVLAICAAVASLGLKELMEQSEPFIMFLYPLIIVLVVCNLLYKLVGFTWVKVPVIVMAVISALLVFGPRLACLMSLVGCPC